MLASGFGSGQGHRMDAARVGLAMYRHLFGALYLRNTHQRCLWYGIHSSHILHVSRLIRLTIWPMIYSPVIINALPPQFIPPAESGMSQRARVSGGYPSCPLQMHVGAADCWSGLLMRVRRPQRTFSLHNAASTRVSDARLHPTSPIQSMITGTISLPDY